MENLPPHLIEVFFEIQRGLPRQGVGCDESTRQAWSLCAELPESPRILDIGCGPGVQTLVLADLSAGQITAIDTCEEYLDELRQRARQKTTAAQIQVTPADMTALNFNGETFDLIWCEGAIYQMGLTAALEEWRSLLAPGGYLAFSELVWLVENPTGEVVEFFHHAYPQMSNRAAIVATLREQGYTPVADFTLPESAWWDDYYTPLAAKLPNLRHKYAHDEAALGVIAMSEAELDIRRRCSDAYGYQFFVTRKLDPPSS